MTSTLSEMTAEFLDAILPTAKDGWLTGAVGHGGHFNGSGKYEFTKFEPFWFRWPAQRDESVAHIQTWAPTADVYTCPYLQKTTSRAKGNAAWRQIVHCDCDKVVDLSEVHRLGGFVIGSGTTGHGHAYIKLAHTVTPTQHDILERALVAHLNGDPGKISDNDLLRPAGARNQKAAANGGTAGFVTLMDAYPAAEVDPFELARMLNVDISGGLRQAPAPAASAERELIVVAQYPRVEEELAVYATQPEGGRSKDTYRIACACRDHGLELKHFRWVIDQRADLAERVRELLARANPIDDVLLVWEKACREWQAANLPPAGSGPPGAPIPPPMAPPGPGNAPPAPAPTPGRFFGKTGFRPLDCALEVTRAVECGYGYPDERFYTYSNGVWSPGQEPIAAEVVHLLGNRYRVGHIKNVTDIIRHQPTTAQIVDAPMADFINVPNGMIHWESGTRLDHDPAYLSTVQLPVEWVPTATCPRFEQFLSEVLPADLLAPTVDGGLGFIWELIGYTLYSGNPIQIAVLLWGKGRNGKGTLIRVIQALVGEANYSSVTLYELIEDKFARAQLYGKLANVAGDLDSKWLENTATFKKVTGHDSLQGEYKYGAKFDFTPWALPFYSANKPFGSTDSSEGWVRRWVVVPFPNCFSGHEDRTLEAKLTSEGELRGILAKAIAALPALMKRGQFADMPSLTATREAFVIASDAVRAWVDEYCNLTPGTWTLRDELYRRYQNHAVADNPKTVISRQQFYNRIEQIAGVTPNRHSNGRGFTGIEFKSPQSFWTP